MTATLYELVSRDLDKIYYEKDKFVGAEPNEHGIITVLDEADYLSKVIKYDDEVKQVMDKIFSFNFTSKMCDAYVKKTFLNRFIDRSIKWEFVPVSSFVWAPKVFTMKLGAYCAEKDKYFSFLYDNFEKYMSSGTEGTSDENASTKNEGNLRELHATLPQTEFNVNVKDYVSPTADDNHLQNTLSDTEHDSKKTDSTSTFNPNILEEMEKAFTVFFDECDKRLFKQIWGSRINEQNH